MAARRWIGPALAALAIVSSCDGLVPVDHSGASGGSAAPGSRTSTRVTRVVDGDTIHVDLDGVDTSIRLIGIDTPEKDGPYTHQECFGLEASAYTERALDGQEVQLEFDVERTDQYDRTLAYVWLDGSLFDEQILADGFALVATYPPNVKYVDQFLAAQRSARDAGRGLWGSCPIGG
ncbi:MAG: thermonuclease family protein [Actinomycetota bacterium]